VRVLLVKSADSKLCNSHKALNADFVWVDRLCNGLISRAAFHEHLLTKKQSDLIFIRPQHAAIDGAFVWADESDFPWKRLQEAQLPAAEFFWAGDFSEKELNQAAKIFKTIKPWKAGADFA